MESIDIKLDEMRHRAFCKVIDYIDANDKMVLSRKDLAVKMQEYLAGSACEPYSNNTLCRKIIKHYGDKIFSTGVSGKHAVFAFTTTVDLILHSFHAQQQKMLKAELSALGGTGDEGCSSMMSD